MDSRLGPITNIEDLFIEGEGLQFVKPPPSEPSPTTNDPQDSNTVSQEDVPRPAQLIRQSSVEDRIRFQAKPGLLNSADFQPSVTVPAPNPKLSSGMKKDRKFSSTATIFMSNAMSAPDVDEIIICLSRALHWNIKLMEKKEPKRFRDIFSEEKFPLGDGKLDFSRSPEVEEIQDFLYTLFNAQDLSAECGVMATAYIERLIKLTGITLHSTNWRRIVLGALILSSKVWEDLAVWNVDFISVFPNLTVQDLNLLEREYLCSLQFTVSLTASVYAKYYFDLRRLSDRTEEFFPMKPLDQKNASLLEAKSKGLEETERIKNLHAKRYYSLNPYESNSTVSLEQFQATFGKNWKDD